MSNSVLILAIVLGLETASGIRAAAPSPVDAGQIAELITQLGSMKFKEREEATHALEGIGGPAIDALQRAARSNDPEIGRRAQSLAHTIQRQIDTGRFLAPLRLHLVYKDTPVVQAVKNLAEKTRFQIELGNPRGLAARRITLDTGDTSFWEALDQFCQKAGLVERTPALEGDLQTTQLLAAGRARRGGIVQVVEAPSGSSSVRGWDGRLLLIDAKPPALPTYHAGAVRIRALPATGPAARNGGDETLFLVEITPQPKVAWHTVIDVRIEKAVDENGQDFAPCLECREEGQPIALTAKGAMLWDAQTGRPVTALHNIPIRLKTGEKPSGVLKEVKGVVAGQVETASQAILTIDDILKSAGRTVMSEDGESLQLVEAHRQPDGDIQLRVEFTDASSTNAPWVMRRGVLRPPNGVVRRGLEDGTSPTNLLLQDGDGHNFPLRNREQDVGIKGNALTRQITLTYRADTGLGEPSKLVYFGRRTLIIEIPFTLKDVPLP
jgi:hypothetical protein